MSDRWTKRWNVQSQSRPDTQYAVAVDRQGRWGCSCWAWRHNQSRDCKHIVAVEAGGLEPNEIVSVTEPNIVLANVKEVTTHLRRGDVTLEQFYLICIVAYVEESQRLRDDLLRLLQQSPVPLYFVGADEEAVDFVEKAS